MLKILIGCMSILMLSPFASSAGVVDIPEEVALEACRALSGDNKGCVNGRVLQRSQTIPLDDNQLLSFFHVKNDDKHVPFSLPLLLDAQGKWKQGQTFIGQTKRIQRDAKGRLWMQANYFFQVNKPLIYLSQNGLTWKGVDLPYDNDTGIAMRQRDIERWCVTGNTLFIELVMSTSSGSLSKRFWQANVNTLLTDGEYADKKWQVAYKQSLDGLACESLSAKNNDWEVQEGETLSLLLLNKNKLTIRLPKELVLGARTVLPATQPQKESENRVRAKAVKQGKFAIQVAAFYQHKFAAGVVKVLQKAKYKTFTRTVQSNGQALKRVYVGPFATRDEAARNLVALKGSFKENDSYQLAFVMQLP